MSLVIDNKNVFWTQGYNIDYSGAGAYAVFAQGKYITASGFNGCFSQGYAITSSGYRGTFSQGEFVTSSGLYGTFSQGLTIINSGSYGSFAQGVLCTAFGIKGAFSQGAFTTSFGTNGTFAQGATVLAGGSNGSFAQGSIVTANGTNGLFAQGNNVTSTGNFGSFAQGSLAIASGSAGSFAQGISVTASGISSWAVGSGVVSDKRGQFARSSGTFSSDGDAQYSLLVVRNTTTNNTQTELFLNGSSERITIASGKSWLFVAYVVGKRTGGVAGGGAVGDTGSYKIEGQIKNISGTTSLGGPTVSTINEDDATWSVTAEADDVNDALVIKVTGDTSKNINWVCRVDLIEVA